MQPSLEMTEKHRMFSAHCEMSWLLSSVLGRDLFPSQICHHKCHELTASQQGGWLAGRREDTLEPLASLRRSSGSNDSHGGYEAGFPLGNTQVEIFIAGPEAAGAAFWSGMSRFLVPRYWTDFLC